MEAIKLIRIKSIVAQSQADLLGVKVGSYVIDFNEVNVRTDAELSSVIRQSKASGKSQHKIGYWQNAKKITQKLTNDAIGIVCEDIELSTEEALELGRKHSDLSILPKTIIDEYVEKVKIYTTPIAYGENTAREIGLVTAECVYGVNLLSDIFNSVRDIAGGRSKTLESLVRDAKEELINEIKYRAALLGADTVLSMQINFSEIGGGGKNGMLMANAIGTAARVQNTDKE